MWTCVTTIPGKGLSSFQSNVESQKKNKPYLFWRIRGENSQKEVALEQNLDDQMLWKNKKCMQ